MAWGDGKYSLSLKSYVILILWGFGSAEHKQTKKQIKKLHCLQRVNKRLDRLDSEES